MTCRELYQQAKRELTAAGVDSPDTDALALSRHFLGMDRSALALHGDKLPSSGQEEGFLLALRQRAERRPLQYILGSWEFMGLSLAVGEGVLCPREDTAALVEALAEALQDVPAPVGLDLCAGSGAVGLGLCSLLPEARVICVELSQAAFPYLEKNLAAYPRLRGSAVRGDVLSPETVQALFASADGPWDFIASNPPYISSRELSGLEPEVRREPALALDGGEDGLVFYRAIAELWLPCLKPGGVLAVEIGEDQGREVSALFQSRGLTDIRVDRDWAGHDRVVLGRTKK